jgi:2-methylcitrate dehydratase PrpD
MPMPASPAPAPGFTTQIAREVTALRYEDLSPQTLARARQVLLDWLGVAIAGSIEPAGRMAQAIAVEADCRPVASLVGTRLRSSPREAALANAVAAHALDFDDGSMWADGHPSATIVSAAVALGEGRGSTTAQVVEAIIAGLQGQVRIALATGPSAYEKGFHGTGTYGTFGAAGACARLLGLDVDGLERAYGLAATQAAGLKVTFGTMAKHLNAGKAAANGMLAAQLAAKGFTAPSDAIEGRQGFAWTQSTTFDPARPQEVMGDRLGIESVLFKRHASCLGTHSTIDGIAHVRARRSFSDDDVADVRLIVSDKLLDTCCIPDPVSGLEGKFSVRHAASVALAGFIAGPDAFTDESVRDPRLVALRKRIEVDPRPDRPMDGPTHVVVNLTSGERLEAEVDVFEPATDAELPAEWSALVHKFEALAAPVVGGPVARDLVRRIDKLDPECPVDQLLGLRDGH